MDIESKVDRFLQVARSQIPGLGLRRHDYTDFLALTNREGLTVRIEPSILDERLDRRGRRPTIYLGAGLTRLYRTFLGFHALGHWWFHPASQEHYLGSPGWLDRMELEATTLGYLALYPDPRQPGPPFPIVERARIDEDACHLWVRYPPTLSVAGRRNGGLRKQGVAEGQRVARLRHTLIPRFVDQLEFEW